MIESLNDKDPNSINLNADDVHTFYNFEAAPFSIHYQNPLKIGDQVFMSVDHFLQWSRFEEKTGMREKICQVSTPTELRTLTNTYENVRDDWTDIRQNILEEATLAKFSQHEDLREQLMGTGKKLLVAIDNDKWLGLKEIDGVQSGENGLGMALQTIRTKFMTDLE